MLCYPNHTLAYQEYATMRDALNNTGRYSLPSSSSSLPALPLSRSPPSSCRPIFFDLCGWYDWYAPVGATLGNEWRIGPDDSNWKRSSTTSTSTLTSLSTLAQVSPLRRLLLPFLFVPNVILGGWNNPCLLLGNDVDGKPLITEYDACFLFFLSFFFLPTPFSIKLLILFFSFFFSSFSLKATEQSSVLHVVDLGSSADAQPKHPKLLRLPT